MSSSGHVFLHLPKTAGHSFVSVLTGAGLSVSTLFDATPLSDERASYLRQFDIVAGHISIVDALRYFPDRPRLTVLRDPVERVISWYWFARSNRVISERPDVIAAKSLTFTEFIRQPYEVLFRNIINRQTRQLGGDTLDSAVSEDKLLERAQRELQSMEWIGILESLSRDLTILGPVLGRTLGPLPLENLSKRGLPISDEDHEMVRGLVGADIELYSRAQELSERQRQVRALD